MYIIIYTFIPIVKTCCILTFNISNLSDKPVQKSASFMNKLIEMKQFVCQQMMS